MTHVLWYADDSHTSWAPGYAPGHYPGSLRWPNYLPQMALCNSGKIAVTYYNMYLPTTDARYGTRILRRT